MHSVPVCHLFCMHFWNAYCVRGTELLLLYDNEVTESPKEIINIPCLKWKLTQKIWII